ncbi:MAG: N-acetyltransferase [Acidobacteriota bacterium]|nr:N-acetyltransferase [Acidobacteriota bacterium]
MTVKPVKGRADRKRFIDLPWKIYRGDSNWVPPLKASVREMLDVKRHPFYDGGREAELELFLAWEGPDVVGRVAAILNHAHNRVHEEKVVFFGFFETIDRPDVARDLLGAVEKWAAERGATVVRGPMNPSTNYECGMLIEGFGRPPALMMTYNPPSYPRLVEGSGYTKAKDLHAYISPVHGASLKRLQRLADRTRDRNPTLTTRGADLSNFEGEVKLVQEIYNEAWEKNWGFVPMTDSEIGWLAKELKPLVQTDLLRFALDDGDPVGFLLVMPDWNPVLADLDGSPWRHPLKTIHHLLKSKPETMEGIRLITLGVKPEHRKRGIEGILIGEGLQKSLEIGYSWCEYSWILEDNELTKRAVRLMDGELYKIYRVYEKSVLSS